MRKVCKVFKILQVQKRIVSAETIRGNTVFEQILMKFKIGYGFYNIPKILAFDLNTLVFAQTIYMASIDLGKNIAD